MSATLEALLGFIKSSLSNLVVNESLSIDFSSRTYISLLPQGACCRVIEVYSISPARLDTHLLVSQLLEPMPSMQGTIIAAHYPALRWVRDRSQIGTYGIQQKMYRFSFVDAA